MMFDVFRVAGLATLALGAVGASSQILPHQVAQAAVPAIAVEPIAPISPAETPTLPPIIAPVEPVAPVREIAPPASLSALVARHSEANTNDAEHRCLAVATYFESKGEPLAGQLAVARVILNRTKSGRFADTACGVVKQRGQFSFVRGGRLPETPRASAQWRTAVAIAHIAQNELHQAPAAGALFFHARRVSPDWNRKTRIAAVGNHVFYR